MERVVSGIRPTGNLHLGNYFGAVKNFLKMQEQYNCYFFIADYHSLTTHPTPADLHGNVRQVLAEYLAAGLDPEKATIYIQSDLPEVAELTLLLRSEEHTSELQSRPHLVCRLLLEKKKRWTYLFIWIMFCKLLSCC